jgi:hypothetical protein
MKDYYAAYIIDPLGNNVEAVYFGWILIRMKSVLQWAVPASIGASLATAVVFWFRRTD